VRSEPSATSDMLGTVYMFSNVQIVGKDASGGWWLILFSDSPNGMGWITAQFVQVSGSSEVPVVNAPQQPALSLPSADASTPSALGNVPTEAEVPIGGTGTPVTQPTAPTGAQAPALEDNDSVQEPAVSIILSDSQARSFTYNSDVSSPKGDPEDWLQFTLAGSSGQPVTVSVTVNCTGNASLNLELVQKNTSLQRWDAIPCGQANQLILSLYAGSPYSLRLMPGRGAGALNYTAYSLSASLR